MPTAIAVPCSTGQSFLLLHSFPCIFDGRIGCRPPAWWQFPNLYASKRQLFSYTCLALFSAYFQASHCCRQLLCLWQWNPSLIVLGGAAKVHAQLAKRRHNLCSCR